MTRRKKLLLTSAAALAGLLVILAAASVLVLQSSWFANFVREKLIATVEDSTGGRVEIGSFQFDWSHHLTVRIRNFVLHGKEARNVDPLLSASLLEVRLKLFGSFSKAVDLEYLGIQNPKANLIVYPDGTTNVPPPKVARQPSNTNGLKIVVDLAIHRFEINNGLLEYGQRKISFNGRGEQLRAFLNYDAQNPKYAGTLAIDPLLFTLEKNPPLAVHVNLPLTIDKDAITLTGGAFTSGQSKIEISAALRNLNVPVITAQAQASISLPEIQHSFNLPIAVQGNLPSVITAQVSARTDQNTNTIDVRNAHLQLGQTNFQANGTMVPGQSNSIQFNGNVALEELGRLAKLTSPRVTGALQLKGAAKLDAKNNYAVDGTINSRELSLRNASVAIPAITLRTPFHADPYLISLDGLRLSALGADLAGKIFLENLKQFSVEGSLRNLPLTALTEAIAGKPLGYDGSLNGPFSLKGDLQAKGTSSYRAQTRLKIAPGQDGMPLSGALNANYAGATGKIDLLNSFLLLPHSRLDLTGTPNQELNVQLLSRNLDDFLPAANFDAAKPTTSFPITLNGGTVAFNAKVTGRLSGKANSPQVDGHVELTRFAAQKRIFDRLALDVSASPSGATIRDGHLVGKTLQTDFSGSLGLHQWQPQPNSPLSASLKMRDADLADLLSLAGEASVPASGRLTADVSINGVYGNPVGSATLQVANGSAYEQPFQLLRTDINLADQLITLSNLELDAAGGQLKGDGTFQHPRDSFSVGHAQVHVSTNALQLANLAAVQRENMGVSGLLQLSANASADVTKTNGETAVAVSNIVADLSTQGLRLHNQPAGNLTAKARTANGNVSYDLTSDFAGSDIRMNGRTALAKNYPTTMDASIQHLSLQNTLLLAAQPDIPARGDLSADAHVTGSLNAPDAKLNFTLAQANLYSEAVNRLQGAVHYSNAIAEIPSIQLDTPAGRVSFTGSFSHPVGDLTRGALKLRLDSSGLDLAKIGHVQEAEPELEGTLHLAADVAANLNNRELMVSNLTADASTKGLALNSRNLGQLTLTAKTTGSNVDIRLDSDIAGSQIHGSGRAQLTHGYPLRAGLTLTNVRYSNLAPLLSADADVNSHFETLVEGKGSIEGKLLEPQTLSARLQLDRVQAGSNKQPSVTGASVSRHVQFENKAPIVATLKNGVMHLEPLRMEGPRSYLTASGEIDLNNANSPLKLSMDANADLGALQDMDHDFYSSGGLVMNAAIRGSFNKPAVNGRVELKNANINYASSPNGLENGNGVVLLNGATATIQNLTGESGGGKISLTGFVGFATSRLNYNLRAAANKVRVRYGDISLTSSANLSLTGNSQRSLLGGVVTIHRLAYSTSSDVGSLLSASSTTPTTAGESPSPFLTAVRLDIRVVTAPDLRVVTSYAERLEVFSNLRVRGNLASPGILGRVSVTNGQLVFFGNTYNVNSGFVDFYNASAIEPVLNVALETNAQGVDVTIGVTGPINDLKLSYRSDPPLTFEQIVQLLATNTTPADATIAAHQPAPPQQSTTQMGESAILGQAVANPLASRVQRVFGLTQFKIDPTLAGGSNGQPSARVTLQQKIASNITFTYTTDVTQTNSELVRVQWDLSTAVSAVALRDFNGNVSVEFFYKFKKR
jgi:translocation and assembly module TamB